MDDFGGWVLPDGSFLKAEHPYHHAELVYLHDPDMDENAAESAGWVKITHSGTGWYIAPGCVRREGYRRIRPTQKQFDRIWDWVCSCGTDERGDEYESFMEEWRD